MSVETAKKFIEALGRLEAGRDLETIVGLFADDFGAGLITTETRGSALRI